MVDSWLKARFARVLILLVAAVTISLASCSTAPPAAPAEKAATPQATSDSKYDSERTGTDPCGDAAHARLVVATRYPSATACGECHPTQFRQWSVSQHAYTQMSPIFNAMQGKIIKGTNGTNGDFCIRCHTQVGMTLGEKKFMSNIDRNPTSREGISCVICHRVTQPYGKLSGRFALVEADITKPVYGPTGKNDELHKAIENTGLVTDPEKAGREVHGETKKFFQITTSAFADRATT